MSSTYLIKYFFCLSPFFKLMKILLAAAREVKVWMLENCARASFSVISLLLRMATEAASSAPEAVSSTRDPSEMRMRGAGLGAGPLTVRCHVTGEGEASTSATPLELVDPATSDIQYNVHI